MFVVLLVPLQENSTVTGTSASERAGTAKTVATTRMAATRASPITRSNVQPRWPARNTYRYVFAQSALDGRYRSGSRRLAEHELAVRRVHQHPIAGLELALEQRQRQLVHELLLDHSPQWPGAVGGVVAEVAYQRPRAVS